MTTEVSRRQTIALLAAGAAGSCATAEPEPATRTPLANAVFLHGVASGDPRADSVVLWTRVETTAPREPVIWEVARDAGFADIVQRGDSIADADADHTVKVVPDGLAPGATYFYRFTVGGTSSPIGRTKTLPVGRLDRLGVALVSCSNHAFGFFNAYDAIAKDPAIDVVLHTGDYIYEYGAGEWGDDVAQVIGRRHEPPHETVSLADYRARHAQYKRDAGSLAMHAAHPLIAIWDDHESANNPWTGGAQNHQPDAEGDWAARRAASIQAYYEWMPLRPPGPGRPEEIWRAYSFGDLATLVTLETRHTGRGEQVDYLDHVASIVSPDARDAFMRDVIGDPDRRMLSAEMESDLAAALKTSVDAGQPWRLIGNPSPIARMLVPDVVGMGVLTPPADPADASDPAAVLAWKGQWRLPFYTDTWDGYPAAREAFYGLCRDAGASDLLVLTGDSHSFWTNRLHDDQGAPMGVELGTAGVSSPGDFVESGFGRDVAEALDRAFETAVDEVVWTDNLHQGYVRVVLTPETADATFVAVDTVLSSDYRTMVLREETIIRRGGSLDLA